MQRNSTEADKENGMQRPLSQQYQHGSIKKIVLKNFLTYDNVVCKPGPYLNVIIGPNGTGKSSIICGICLAVGGAPRLLGRSDNVSDFVKHGKQQGSVDLHIWDAERKREVIFTIIIYAHKNSASHLIDGRQKKVSELREEVKQYNIQVDNPCTFLAQDKVKSFAEQGAQMLLFNTEKAGPEILTEVHDELIEIAKDGCGYEDKLKRLRKRLENIELELKTRKARMENYQEWANRQEGLKSLRIKMAHIDYEQQLEDLRTATAHLDDVQKKQDETKSRLDPIEKSIRSLKLTIMELGKEMDQLKREKHAEIGKIRELVNNTTMDDQLQEAALQFQRIQEAYQNWDRGQEDLARDLRKFKDIYERTKLTNVPDPELPQVQATLEGEQQQFRQEENAILDKQSSLFRLGNQLHSRLNFQNSSMENKLRNIMRMRNNPDIPQAWDYYTKNRDKFRGPVFVPFLNVHIPDINNAVYFNNLINNRDLGIFIFSCRDDEELMLGKFKIDSSIVRQEMVEEFRSAKVELSDELRTLGFVDYMINLFQAPPPVTAYLNGNYNLDKLLIGGSSVDENYERICKQAKQINRSFTVFLTRKLKIDVFNSRFEPDKEYVERRPMHHNIQKFDVDHTRRHYDMDEEMAQLEREKNNLEERKVKLQNGREALRSKMLEFRERLMKKRKDDEQLESLLQQVKKYENRMQDYGKDKPDLAMARAAYLENKRQIMMATMESLEKLTELLEKQRHKVATYALVCDELTRLKGRKRCLEMEKEGLSEKGEEEKSEYEEAMKRRKKVKDDLEYMKERFKKVAEFSPADSEMSREEKSKFANIKRDWAKKEVPDNHDALDALIRREEAKLSKGRQEGTQEDVDEYERLQKERDESGYDIAKTEEKNDRWKQKMDEKLDVWLRKLRKLIAKISKNFSEFFSLLQCAGEVHLVEPENKYKIEEYGIKIFVKFRNGTSLRELNSQTQSGGERSVATMLYIMALQNLSFVPFRCVDEINQGMDPQNERAVFNMMVNLLNTGDNVSKTQYFLLTPKLLNGLQFNERVAVHIIHNGPAIENGENWDVERFLNAP